MASIVKIENLVVALNHNRILDCLNLTVTQGEILSVIGPNGSGKTTLLKCLAGILSPQAGKIVILGRERAAWSGLELARKVAYLPQEHQCYWNFKVEDVVNLGASRGKGFTGWESLVFRHRKDLQSIYRNLELEHLQGRIVRTLSGGERARVMLASVLAGKPQLLLADEPTANLDITHQHRIMELMRKLSSDMAMTIMVVLHDLNLAARYADRLALIDRGQCSVVLPTIEMMVSDKLDEVYGMRFQRFHQCGKVYVLPT